MPPKRGQIETLPGITSPISTSELSRSRALSTITRPEMWGITVDQYEDITDRMISRADPSAFAADLYGKSGFNPKKYVVDYEEDSGSRRAVALTADEYRILPRSMNLDNPASTVKSGVEAGKYSLTSKEKRDRKVEEATEEAFIGMYSKMKGRVGILQEETVLLGRLEEASDTFWLARGHADRLRVEVSQVRDLILPRMMEVVGRQRGWTEEQQLLATRSLEYRLFFTMPDASRMKEWKNTLELIRNWDERKIFAFQDRMGRIEGRFGKETVRSAIK